jgi:AraC-like DNA-binding protein
LTVNHSSRVSADVPAPGIRERLLSAGVSGSRYIFPNLAPARDEVWTLALAGREECAPDYVVDRASYPFHVVEYVAEGRGVARLGRRPEQRISAGSIFAYAPETKCRIQTDATFPLVKFFFAVAGRDVERMLADAALRPGTIRRFAAPAEGLTIAEDIIHEGQRHTAKAPAVCLKLLELLLLKAADAPGENSPSDARARDNFLRCRAMIETHADRWRTLEEVAEAAKLDVASICRLFRRFQGTSPYQYLLRRKMALAAEYLIDSGGLVKEAAARVGFADPYHFARCFKAVHGVAPSELRGLR